MFARFNKQNIYYWLITACGVYALAPFFIIARYNQPAADDYYGAVRDAKQSLCAVLADTYLHWSGRYFATLTARINPLLYHSPAAYKLYAVLLLLAFASALMVLLKQITAPYFIWKQTIAFCCVLLCLYFSVMPSVAEGFYWFSGAYVYQAANVLFMLLLTLLIKLQRQSTRHKKICVLLALLLAICIVGCNEISLIITCCVVIFIAVIKHNTNKRPDTPLAAVAVITVIAASFAVFAPGNFVRMNDLQEYSKSPLWALAGAAGITLVYLSQWAAPVLIGTLVYIPLFGNGLAQKMRAQGKTFGVKPMLFATLFASLFLLLQLFAVWVAGGSNLGRIENVIYLYFLLGWFFVVQLFINEHRRMPRPVSYFSKPLFMVVMLLFVASVFNINNNISTAYIDLISGKANAYNKELDERMVMAKKSTTDTCYVPPLTALPQTIFFADIKCTADSIDFWMNKAYSAYVGKGYVLVTAPLPPTQTNIETLRSLGKGMRGNMFESGK